MGDDKDIVKMTTWPVEKAAPVFKADLDLCGPGRLLALATWRRWHESGRHHPSGATEGVAG